MTYPNIKTKAFAHCKQWAEERQKAINNKEALLKEALQGATKSSAGDKHNTERAMLQLEREQLGLQLKALETDINTMARIDTAAVSERVRLGSVVYTPSAIYFICVSAGVFSIDDTQIVAVSSAAPIAQAILGKTNGDSFTWRAKTYPILAVY